MTKHSAGVTHIFFYSVQKAEGIVCKINPSAFKLNTSISLTALQQNRVYLAIIFNLSLQWSVASGVWYHCLIAGL